MLTAEQLVASQKTNIETLFSLTGRAFEGAEKLIELNLQVAKAAMNEVAQNASTALSAKDPQEWLSSQSTWLQPSAEKAAAYSRHLYEIASSTNADISKSTESQLAEAQKKFMSMVDSAIKNAPAGTESAVALVKSAVAAANNAYESVHKASKQAVDVAEANFQAMTATAVKASQTAAKTKRA
jgi:phasin family protein